MRPIRLYIENFMCHEVSEIDFTTFSSALIVGKINGNDLFSNGTGKSSIFKAIEYVLFNKARETNLEKLVRDGSAKCKIVMDFELNNNIYRVSRSRTAKGTSDLSLWKRNACEGINAHSSELTEDQVKLYWDNITGRRAIDTEEELKKLHKMTLESFISANHFVQNDFSGLPTATAGQRKKILKDALQLLIYAKLEKIANEEAKILTKDLDKKRGGVSIIGDPKKDIIDLSEKLNMISNLISNKNTQIDLKKSEIDNLTLKLSGLSSKYITLDTQSSTILKKRTDSIAKVKKLETNTDESDKKRKNAANIGRELIKENKALKEKETSLKDIDISKLEALKLNINTLRENIAVNASNISSLKNELIDLKIPMPDDSLCKHCRQPLTDAHRRVCKDEIKDEIKSKEDKITELQLSITANKSEIINIEKTIQEIESVKTQLNAITTKISIKENEISEKIKLHDEYNSIWKALNLELTYAKEELELAKQDAINSSEQELLILKDEILNEKEKLNNLKTDLVILTTHLNKFINDKTVIEYSIAEKNKDLIKKEDLEKEIVLIDDSYSIYPDVIEAFSSRGIPNLIVHNVLDDLQLEANELLSQLKPGLQLSFAIEKTKGDGEIDDDLNINYSLNGKDRDFGQLSGAMKLCVLFSLKLGLSFLLKKTIGASINFLLIDEIDSALDKAGIDAFADIIKFFQKDFMILVITHNDRLKEKFSSIISVEQNSDMITTAKAITI